MDHGTRPTILLTERRSTLCRLSGADAAFLLREHRGHVAVASSGRRHRYCLTPRGHVGTLVAPDCRLVIRPKIPVRNLFHFLAPDAPLPALEDRTEAAHGSELLDLLAAHLAQLMEERSSQGLHRAYVERAGQGPFLHGRLDVPAQVRELHKETVHCRYEEFTADVPCNQVPRTTAELLLRSPLLAEEVRTRLRLCLRGFAGVSSVALGPDTFPQDSPHRLLEAYRPLLDLCRLLAESLTPGGQAGQLGCPAFLLDMERVFESYCTRALVSALGDRYTLDVQPLFRPGSLGPGQPELWMRPDLTLHRGGQPSVVVDAKWKRSAHVRTDLYQVLAYCTALGFPRGVLVYPGRRDRSWEYAFGSGVRLAVQVLRVSGTRDSCQQALRTLVRTCLGEPE